MLKYNYMKWQSLTKKQKMYVIVSSAITLILLWSFFSAKLLTSGLNRKDLAQNGESQQALVEGIILTETKNEEKYWEIYGDTGLYDSKQDTASLNNVHANFFKDNKVSMSIVSSKGSYDAKTKTITLYEDTYLVIEQGLTLSADKLIYKGSNEPILAYGNVIVTKGDEFMANADEIEISADYSNIKIKGNTTSKIYNGSNNEK